jgi:hypothetical protein
MYIVNTFMGISKAPFNEITIFTEVVFSLLEFGTWLIKYGAKAPN